MDALILSEATRSPELTELRQELIGLGLKCRVIPHNQFSTIYADWQNIGDFKDPHLIYVSPTIRHQNPKEVLAYHRRNIDFPCLFSSTQEYVSMNPARVKILQDQRIKFQGNYFLLKQGSSHRFIGNPVHILLMANQRADYLKLSWNALKFSMGSYFEQVPLTLVLSDPSPEVLLLAQGWLEAYPHIRVIRYNRNCYLGITNYAVQWHFRNVPGFRRFLIYEDDFILPATVKDLYPGWPWQFARRLDAHDVVAWAPSLDNITTPYRKYLFREGAFSMIADNTTRPSVQNGVRWLTTHDHYRLFTCGNANALDLGFYLECARMAPNYIPVDHTFELLSQSRCTPTTYGYHIGWNQEQDGYPALHSARWRITPSEIDITDLRTQMTERYRSGDICSL